MSAKGASVNTLLSSLELPEDIKAALQAAGYTPQRVTEEAIRHYAGVLFARKALTLEQAARLAGMALWDFIPFLSAQSIPIAEYDADEIEVELESVRWLKKMPQE